MIAARDCLLEDNAFKERLDTARRRDRPEEFKTLLMQIQNLKAFCCDENDKAIIRTLYKQARDILRAVPETSQEKYLPFFDIVEQGAIETLPLAEQYPTERYQRASWKSEEQFGEFLSGNRFDVDTVRGFQTEITQKIRDFFQLLFNDATTLVGPPPCTYNFRAMGSLGREEPCPFSDLELMVLIERDDDETRHYFNTLIRVIELQVISLGETANKHIIFTCIYEKNPSGFHFDDGGNPRKDRSLLATPSGMAQLQRQMDLSDATLAPRLIPF